MRSLSPIVSPQDLQRVVGTPVELTGNYTVQLADANQSFSYNGGGAITVTFPSGLPDGFKCKIYNCGLGSVNFAMPSGFIHFGNAGRLGLIFQWDVADIQLLTISATPIFMTIYNLALPVLFGYNSAAQTRNVVALSSMGISIPLEGSSSYDIDFSVIFTTTATANSLRVGLAALPTGASCALEATIYNTNAAGTAAAVRKSMLSSAEAVTGAAGSASIASTPMLARITGRITLATAGGNLVPTIGALATTSTVSVAAQAASMSVSKVFDLLRT